MHRTIATAALAVLLLAGCGATEAPAATPTPSESDTAVGVALETLATQCIGINHPGATVGDGGKSLTLDGMGEEDASGVGYDSLMCVLGGVGLPDSVRSDIEATRALDGRQEASWDAFTLVWRYHPDSGLEMILTRD